MALKSYAYIIRACKIVNDSIRGTDPSMAYRWKKPRQAGYTRPYNAVGVSVVFGVDFIGAGVVPYIELVVILIVSNKIVFGLILSHYF